MELTTGNLIKIILGVLVIAAVAFGIYTFFRGTVVDFFKNFGGSSELFRVIIS